MTKITQTMVEDARNLAQQHSIKYDQANQRIKAQFGKNWSLRTDLSFYEPPAGLVEAIQAEKANLEQFEISAEEFGLDTFDLLDLLDQL